MPTHSLLHRTFRWICAQHEISVNNYRLIFSLAAYGYLIYYAAINPVGNWFVAVVITLTCFALDDLFVRFKLPRRREEPPLSLK